VQERIAADWKAGVRVGVATTPTLFADGERLSGRPDPSILEALANRK
jgi:protein-disulfide isomerase